MTLIFFFFSHSFVQLDLCFESVSNVVFEPSYCLQLCSTISRWFHQTIKDFVTWFWDEFGEV